MIFSFFPARRQTAFFLTTIFFLFWPLAAPAHTLKSDGQVGVIFHLQPNDQPRVGQQTTLYLEFSDRQKIFQLSDCVCQVSVTKNDQVLLTNKLSSINQKNPNQAELPLTFPNPGSYVIRMQGQPHSSPTFSSFDVTYTVQVINPRQYSARQKQIATTIYHSLHYGSIGAGAVFVIWRSYRDWRKRKNT